MSKVGWGAGADEGPRTAVVHRHRRHPIERSAFGNLEIGIIDVRSRGRTRARGDYAGRLQRLAGELGGSNAAVLKRPGATGGGE